MTNQFTPFPLVIIKEGTTIGVHELAYDNEEVFFILKIVDINGDVLYSGIPCEDNIPSVDVTSRHITLEYIDGANQSHVLFAESVNLTEEYDFTEESLAVKASIQAEKMRYENIVERVKREMDNPQGTIKEVENHTLMLNRSTTSAKARAYVETKIRQIIESVDTLPEEKVEEYTKKIYADFYGMGVIQELDDDPRVGEILVNGFVFPHFRCEVYYYIDGKKLPYNKTFASFDDMYNVFSRSIAFSKKELNNVENALVEATRANRDRVNVIIPDASESYVLNIRKFGNFVPDLSSMKETGTVDEYIDNFMNIVVRGKANIGIGGEMGTGKTTFINYALTYTEPIERKVVIASVSETDVERVLKGHDVVILNVDEAKGFTFSKLIRASLRTTASRVIIPESRGDEFKQVYEANLKTKGNMFTAHALSDYEFLDMCVDMYIGDNGTANVDNVRNKIAKSVDIIIIMRKVGAKIRVDSISEILRDEKQNFDRMNLLYYWEADPEDATKGHYQRTENRLSAETKKRLNKNGVPMSELINF